MESQWLIAARGSEWADWIAGVSRYGDGAGVAGFVAAAAYCSTSTHCCTCWTSVECGSTRNNVMALVEM